MKQIKNTLQNDGTYFKKATISKKIYKFSLRQFFSLPSRPCSYIGGPSYKLQAYLYEKHIQVLRRL